MAIEHVAAGSCQVGEALVLCKLEHGLGLGGVEGGLVGLEKILGSA